MFDSVVCFFVRQTHHLSNSGTEYVCGGKSILRRSTQKFIVLPTICVRTHTHEHTEHTGTAYKKVSLAV